MQQKKKAAAKNQQAQTHNQQQQQQRRIDGFLVADPHKTAQQQQQKVELQMAREQQRQLKLQQQQQRQTSVGLQSVTGDAEDPIELSDDDHDGGMLDVGQHQQQQQQQGRDRQQQPEQQQRPPAAVRVTDASEIQRLVDMANPPEVSHASPGTGPVSMLKRASGCVKSFHA
jgi:hypothetical protein